MIHSVSRLFLYHFTTIVLLSCITYLIIFHLLYK
nr:MAG TPA: hypothetical protein [Caudoviricetes sp.]